MKKFFKVLLIILLCVVLLVGAYFAYVFLAYKRIDDMQELGVTVPEAAGPDAVAAGEPLKIVSYNVGFGAYSADYDFFMDGGTQSWAFSKEAVYTNIAGAVNEIKSAAPDFVFVQEV
ncbi:MAG: endonuclease/exonuclease/phosphatase family protein, partial [Oscillospiraceae bacterium]|nr:endonuclease/exonuclease/phosphatase family protein [Oscillospiraceae bacterium]